MCVAVPGKVIEIQGNKAKVNVLNNICQADIRLVNVNVGDYVLIHAGCVLQVVNKQLAEEMIDIFQELGEEEVK